MSGLTIQRRKMLAGIALLVGSLSAPSRVLGADNSKIKRAAAEIESRLREIEQLGHTNDAVKSKIDHIRDALKVIMEAVK